MRTRDREKILAEAGRGLESMLRHFMEHAMKVEALGVMIPDMPPWETFAGMRRKIERLRAGKVRGLDPRVPLLLLADVMELSLEKAIITRLVVADMNGQTELERSINERLVAERLRRSVAGFHALKKSPEAADPESPVAEKVRRIHRERKKEQGRGRKRKG
ncbi:MAG TPA: hypothetical protein VLC46_26180 [Thermoanaerobaculia bacterium]|jgi:hypothetical protein|nr:hypothetical protein [Thermoanaerobaculia bacterium]